MRTFRTRFFVRVSASVLLVLLACLSVSAEQTPRRRFQKLRDVLRRVPMKERDLRPMVHAPPQLVLDLTHLRAPNIVIDSVQFSPDTYVPGETVRARLILHNAGIETSGAFHVRWRPYQTHPGIVKYVPSLRQGVGGSVDFEYRFTWKTSQSFFEVDCYDEVAETNEDDNEAMGHPTVGPSAWDFYVADIWLRNPLGPDLPVRPVGGEDSDICFSVGFVNTVNTDTQPVRVDIYVDGTKRHSCPFIIPANQTRASHFIHNVGAGEHTIRVAPAHAITEADTTNNELSKAFVWRTRPQRPYRFECFSINDYDAVGGGGDLHFSNNEGRRFYWTMHGYGHTGIYGAEDGDVICDDWGYGVNAKVNWGDMAYFAGHGDYNGPWYNLHGRDDADVLQMCPDKYRFGRDPSGAQNLRWCTWSACSTLDDGVRDSSRANWWDGDLALSRWFQVFEGLHSIMGMRSLGWQGEWYDFADIAIYDTRLRAQRYVDYLEDDGYTFTYAWFMANRKTVYDRMDRGFEAATLSANTEGTDYTLETSRSPFADYLGTPTGFIYNAYRIGSPSW